jgi:hypothetical protein
VGSIEHSVAVARTVDDVVVNEVLTVTTVVAGSVDRTLLVVESAMKVVVVRLASAVVVTSTVAAV